MSPSVDPSSLGIATLTVPLGGLALVVARPSVVASDRSRRAWIPLVALVVGAAVWAGADAVSGNLPAVGPAVLVARLRYVAVGVVVAGWFALALGIAGYDRRLALPVVAVEPVLVGIAALTNPYHHLFFTESRLVAEDGTRLVLTPGPLFFVHSIVSYAVLAAGLAILIVGIGRLDRRIAAVVLPVLALPIAFNLAFVSGIAPVPVDATPVGVAIVALALAGVLRYDGRSDAAVEGGADAGDAPDTSG